MRSPFRLTVLAATIISLLLLVPLISMAVAQVSPVPTTIEDFFMPGSQPGDSGNLEHPSKCDNCHGGYDLAVEPAFNWRGSMMAQAQRDPLYYATMSVANQDAPDSGDLCLRCHTPSGWLEGRSVPTDGSALNSNDFEGVQCDFCHKLVEPTAIGVNPNPDNPFYTDGTYPRDQEYLGTLEAIPPANANGMYVVDRDNAKRGPFVFTVARHQEYYSPFHQKSDLCGTCHDVSNPAFSRQADGTYLPNEFNQAAPDADPYSLFPVERTYSEWKSSDYAAAGVSCQDCHMRDVTGAGCNKPDAPIRDNLPLHDMTGGNTFIPGLVAQLFPGEVDPAALDAGVERARQNLQNAAALWLNVDPGSKVANVTVVNNTGHKLPSGYPEGRRMWINVKAYDAGGNLIYESGAYDSDTAVLSHDAEAKIYEVKPGISEEIAPVVNLPAGPSFHFVLNNTIYSDNRIPPRGFTNAAFEAVQSPPVNYSYADGQYWDTTTYNLPAATASATATLYYQTTSKEYIEFLRDENQTDHWGQTMYDLWANNGMSTPEMMESASWGSPPVQDIEAPTAPGNLSARGSSSSTVDLSWDASSDNVGVTAYRIYRDGVEVKVVNGATTSWQDTGLAARTTYSYYVVAVDLANNHSDPSNTATATTRKGKASGGGR
ncbi:MAG: fibronectin type III domain-containing protein [Thermoleophilia bacterium]